MEQKANDALISVIDTSLNSPTRKLGSQQTTAYVWKWNNGERPIKQFSLLLNIYEPVDSKSKSLKLPAAGCKGTTAALTNQASNNIHAL